MRPIYIFVPENRIDAFIQRRNCGPAAVSGYRLPDYTAIIDQQAFDRLMDTIADVREKGGRVTPLLDGPDTILEYKKFPP